MHNYCGTILLVLSSGLEGHFPLHSYCRRTTAAVCSLVAGPRNAGSPTVLLDSVASRTEDFPYLVWGNVGSGSYSNVCRWLLTTSEMSTKYHRNPELGWLWMERLPEEGKKQQVTYLGFILCLTENRQLPSWEHPRHTELRGFWESQDSVELGSRTRALKGHILSSLLWQKSTKQPVKWEIQG